LRNPAATSRFALMAMAISYLGVEIAVYASGLLSFSSLIVLLVIAVGVVVIGLINEVGGLRSANSERKKLTVDLDKLEKEVG